MPTDRCTAEWWLNHPRHADSAGTPPPRPAIEARIEVPTPSEWRQTDPARARESQARISDAFETSFAAGLAVVGVDRNGESGTYVLGKWSIEE
jgi:predicted GNAT superfamily acetyltransferase